ncbi:hypothetical protein [Velocimicrobium porci]|uniref:Uncharacterized protein n=1 Tax=Velocimicrobium porci TaxID=2606634 RepID=A0A6L5XZ12_9FIRM|nr:hypothetical protein [Velocimicrobium porci]MSS64002.1 hypothetical protein [Velocimicrobium porci]
MTDQERLDEISRKKKIEQVRKEIAPPGKGGKGIQIRLLLASILFLLFLVGKQGNFSYRGWNCEKIMQIVQYDIGIDSVEEKIISVFHRLN